MRRWTRFELAHDGTGAVYSRTLVPVNGTQLRAMQKFELCEGLHQFIEFRIHHHQERSAAGPVKNSLQFSEYLPHNLRAERVKEIKNHIIVWKFEIQRIFI